MASETFDSLIFVQVQIRGERLAECGAVAYWRGGDGADPAYHAREIIEHFEQLRPFVEAIKAHFQPAQAEAA